MKKTQLTIVISTRKLDQYYIDLLKSTSGIKNLQIIPFENSNGESLTKLYNKGLVMSTSDLVLFCHDDLKFDTRNWGRKLLNHFKRDSEYGIIGIAGTRYLSKTGRWWDDFSKMHGAVYHEDEGKRWLTRYSKDVGNKLDDVIKVTHLSIGKTNEEWEDSRKTFSEKYKDNLPVKINRKLRKNEKLKILIACLNFNDFTGSELHVYELAKSLKELGHSVTICSNVGGDIEKRVKALGIETYPSNEPPGFKVGDGELSLKTPQGPVLMEKGQLYKISDGNFDVMHLHHKPITEQFLKMYPTTPVVTTIHSEVIDLEHPVKEDRVSHYICIRPEIQDYIVGKFGIDVKKTSVIYNPFDTTRFKPTQKPKNQKERVLFVGTIDYLRQNAILDLVKETEKNNQELWIVGRKRTSILDNLGLDHVKYFEPTWSVESYIEQCDITAGILLGRTTIEGWLCGKPGIIYDIDESGEIKSKKLHNPPEDINKFSSKTIIGEIIKTYELAL